MRMFEEYVLPSAFVSLLCSSISLTFSSNAIFSFCNSLNCCSLSSSIFLKFSVLNLHLEPFYSIWFVCLWYFVMCLFFFLCKWKSFLCNGKLLNWLWTVLIYPVFSSFSVWFTTLAFNSVSLAAIVLPICALSFCNSHCFSCIDGKLSQHLSQDFRIGDCEGWAVWGGNNFSIADTLKIILASNRCWSWSVQNI